MAKTLVTFDVGVKNLSYCIYDNIQNKIVQWERVSIVDPNADVKKLGIDKLTDAMLSFLSKTFFSDNEIYSLVLIENQPSVMNGLMKSMAMVIYTYFKIHQPTKTVRFINSCNKLKCEKSRELVKQTKGYNDRKKLAVSTCRLYLEELAPCKLDWFDSLKKADDYADCFLYIMYTLESETI